MSIACGWEHAENRNRHWRLRVIRQVARWSIWPWVVLLVLAAIPIMNADPSGFFNWVDQNAPTIYSASRAHELLFVWHRYDAYFGKNIAPYFTRELPLQALISLLVRIGLTPYVVQRLFIVISLASMGWAMYFLAISFSKRRRARVLGLISAAFYMFNPQTLGLLYYNPPHRLLVTAMMPAILGVYVRGLKERRWFNRYSLALGILSVVTAASGNVQFIWLTLQPTFLYLLWFLLRERSAKSMVHALRFTIGAVAIGLLFNAYWLLPTVADARYAYSEMASVQAMKEKLVYKKPVAAGMLSNFLLWRYGGGPRPNHTPYADYYGGIGAVIGAMLVVLSLAATVVRRNREVVFFSATALFYLGLQAGIPTCLYNVWAWLNDNLPLGSVLVTWLPDRFSPMVMLCYSYLLGVTVGMVLDRAGALKERFGVRASRTLACGVVGLTLGLVLVNGWPILIWRFGADRVAVEVPDYYYRAGKWLAAQEEQFRIFSLPHHNYNLIYMNYDWQPYSSVDFVQQGGTIIPKPLIQLRPGDPAQPLVVKLATDEFYKRVLYGQQVPPNYLRLLGNMNIKYLLLRGDVKPNIQGLTGTAIASVLVSNQHFRYVGKFGKLYFFENPSFMPLVFSVDRIAVVNGGAYEVVRLNMSDGYSPRMAAIAATDFLTPAALKLLNSIGDTITVPVSVTAIHVRDGQTDRFSWDELEPGEAIALFYENRKTLVRTDGVSDDTALTFSSRAAAPYVFPPFSPGIWNASNATVIYLKTSDQPLRIDVIKDESGIISAEPSRWQDGVVGIWWESGWVGMATKPVVFPIIIPPNEKAIIQIAGRHDSIYLETLDTTGLQQRLGQTPPASATVHFRSINPTHYEIQVVDWSRPFFLVFSERYHPGWKLYVEHLTTTSDVLEPRGGVPHDVELNRETGRFSLGDVRYLFARPLSEDLHFQVNGYANAWYLDPDALGIEVGEPFVIELVFYPQGYFIIGATVSVLTLFICSGIVWGRRGLR